MEKPAKKKRVLPVILSTIMPITYMCGAFSATPIDLSHQGISTLNSFLSSSGKKLSEEPIDLQETKRSIDFKHTLHIRVKETYEGHPVFGGDGIIHIPEGATKKGTSLSAVSQAKGADVTMDGVIYRDIKPDLANTPNFALNKGQAQKALDQVISAFQNQNKNFTEITNKKSELIVYIDEKNQGHWAYHVSFDAKPNQEGMPARPNFIVDAISLKVYVKWDDIKTIEQLVTDGGGYGGNKKIGRVMYIGTKDLKLDKLAITRDTDSKICYLKNKEVTVKHYRSNELAQFECEKLDGTHNNLYWDGDLDAVNGGYSPDNDALFGGATIKNMYEKWYGVPVLIEQDDFDTPMMLVMVVHAPIDNAYWDGRQMTFGDGIRVFYPLTSVGVASHEISHGFTEQHSDLYYFGQPGGINESFSDMAAQAAELFAFGKNSWQIGGEIYKKENESLRYMDKPSKDCHGKKPGDWCSIDNAKQYKSGLDVHYSSGVYNHFFYFLGTTKHWDAKKAFDVMLHANSNYWTPTSNFKSAACGVIKATKDLKYEVKDVVNAFKLVAIDTSSC